MQKITAAIITFNEERNIGRCLDSLEGVADDIVVVDSFSSDSTRSICELRGVRFIEHAFEGHIQQKNYAVSQALYPIVLSLDADEALSAELRSSIMEAKAVWDYDGYTMNRLTNYAGKWIRHSGWYPDRKLRLWDSRKGRWGGVNPHDRYEMESGSSQGHLKGDILHYSFASISEHVNQSDKFARIMAVALYEKGRKAGFLHILFKPPARFLRDYIFHRGFLDGYEGLVICSITAFGVFLKYSRLRKLCHAGIEASDVL
jgi:glycosyltransferase involved in cell wall biosynthesis